MFRRPVGITAVFRLFGFGWGEYVVQPFLRVRCIGIDTARRFFAGKRIFGRPAFIPRLDHFG